MNKYQESFNEIISALKKDDLYMGDSSYDFIDKDDITLIQELVDKATPMTPKKELMTGSGATAIYEIVCGDCEGVVERYFSYCPYCSKQIDWKNYEE